jgi:hypothetical protein
MARKMKKVKMTINVILIDPKARTIAKVETTGNLEHLQQLVQTDFIETLRGSGNNLIMFGENPKPTEGFFVLSGVKIKGRALVVGTHGEEMMDPTASVDELRSIITFAKETQ